LLFVELHVHPGRVALQAFRSGAAALSACARCAGAVLLLCSGIALLVALGRILAANALAFLGGIVAVSLLVFSRAPIVLLLSLAGLRLSATGR
jgi:hypothetical protein